LVRILAKAETALDNITTTVQNANQLFGDPQMRANLVKMINDLPNTLAQLNKAMASIQETFATADRNLRNLEGLTRPLGQRGEQLVTNIEQATQGISGLVADLGAFAQALTNSNGTLGKLINDPQLYL